jgi:hypothetical protein
MAVATLLETEQIASVIHYPRGAGSSLPFFLVISQQSMNLAMRFFAHSVNLWTKPLSQSCVIEQRLKLIVVVVKQRPDLVLRSRCGGRAPNRVATLRIVKVNRHAFDTCET